MRNAHLYFTSGVTYTLLGNHVALKSKIQEPCVFDAGASRLTPIVERIPTFAPLAIFNSDFFSNYLKRFLKHTAAYEISDLRMMPLLTLYLCKRRAFGIRVLLRLTLLFPKRLSFYSGL